MKYIRKAYEDALNQYGETNSGLKTCPVLLLIFLQNPFIPLHTDNYIY